MKINPSRKIYFGRSLNNAGKRPTIKDNRPVPEKVTNIAGMNKKSRLKFLKK
jgi:hypothetical protein